jgi:hypothetical protein
MPRLGRVELRSAVPAIADQREAERAETLLRAFCRRQWHRPRPVSMLARPIATQDVRTGHLDGVPMRRLVVTLNPAGCGWGRRGGGCVMCGHYLARTERPPTAAELAESWGPVVKSLKAGQIPILCLYNEGNVLNPDELPLDGVVDLCRRLSRLAFFRRLVIETRPEFITPGRIRSLTGALAAGQSLALGLGVETANDDVRRLCLNKGLRWDDYAQAVRTAGCRFRFYVFFGAPFLTEAEMLTDAHLSLTRFQELAPEEIHVEAATIQRGTLLNRLWRNDSYDLPSLWSLVFLLRALPAGIRPYVGPFNHFPMPYQVPTSCVRCEGQVRAALEDYNRSLDRAAFDRLSCPCLDSWFERIHESDRRPLEQRLTSCLEELALPAEADRPRDTVARAPAVAVV